MKTEVANSRVRLLLLGFTVFSPSICRSEQGALHERLPLSFFFFISDGAHDDSRLHCLFLRDHCHDVTTKEGEYAPIRESKEEKARVKHGLTVRRKHLCYMEHVVRQDGEYGSDEKAGEDGEDESFYVWAPRLEKKPQINANEREQWFIGKFVDDANGHLDSGMGRTA